MFTVLTDLIMDKLLCLKLLKDTARFLESIKMMNYNVAGIQEFVSAKELESVLKKRYPGTDITYKPDSSLQQIGNDFRTLKRFDDSYAREQWGWKPEYDSPEAIIDVFEKDLKSYPERYGLSDSE